MISLKVEINSERLERNLYQLAQTGKNENGGINRAFGSQSDIDARNWIMKYWKEHLGINIRIDAVGNMWARREGIEKLPPIVFGSHHDAVPDGGMFDGALGVLVATEIMEILIENNIKTKHPFSIVSFTGEEPNPFNVSTLGTKVLSGRLNKNDLEQLKSYIDGQTMDAALKKVGGDINKIDDILIKPGDIAAFVECHIEQGRRLYDKKLSSASVSCITGIYRENIIIYGETNHAGTTNMEERHDALLAAGEFNLLFEELIKNEKNPEVVGTIGYMVVKPNAVGIVPGEVEFVLEIRTSDAIIRKKFVQNIAEITQKVEKQRGVKIERKLNLDQPEMLMDKDVANAILSEMTEQNERPEFVSMAGHDAANMQRVTKSGMIFVQSINGKSHCPDELSDMKAIKETANVMIRSLLKLDKELM